MPIQEIYINDVLIELPGKPVVALTSQINDLSELKDHRSKRSTTIKAPTTKSNLAAFGYADQVESATVKPYRKNRARVVMDGIDVVKDGYAILNSIDSTINFTVYEGNVDFFDAIEGKKLYDLSLPSLDHSYNLTSILSYNAAATGIKYSMINYGYFTNTNRIIDAKNIRPVVFHDVILKEIIQEAGFIGEGLILSNPDYLKEIIPFTNGSNPDLWYNKTIYELVEGAWSAINATDPESYLDGQLATPGTPPTYHYNYDLTVYLRYKITASTGTNYVQADIFGNGGVLATEVFGGADGINEVSFTRSATGDGPLGLKLTIRNCTVEILGGRIYGTIRPRDPSEGPESGISFFVTKKSIVGNNTPLTIFAGFSKNDTQEWFEPFEMQNFLPDMTQKDFIKAWANRYCVLFTTDIYNKKIYLKQFNEIVEDCAIAKDWTRKLHRDKASKSVEYKVDGYSQKNYYKYKEDSNDKVIKKGLGNGTLSVDDTTLSIDNTKIELPYSATQMESMLLGINVPRIQKLDDNDEFTVSTEPRILIDDTQNISGTAITYENGTASSNETNDIPLCYFISKDSENNLGFENSLLQRSYAEFTRVLNRSKKVTALFNLSCLDFYTLDHFIPVYLGQDSSYYYINKVLNFQGQGLTKVELIRIGERKQALIGLMQRCTSIGIDDGYGQINRLWETGIHTFILRKMIVEGVEYASGQTLVVNAPGDLIVGVGMDGNNYIMNVSDWINTILPDGYMIRDNGVVFEYPVDASFLIEIEYIDGASGFGSNTYQYDNMGFHINGSLYQQYTCELIR